MDLHDHMGMERQQPSIVKVAIWLAEEVREGGTFTKQQLREAVPNVEQADRRMRDLRKYGWRIDTSAEDASLRLNELRLVKIGDKVWDRRARRQLPSRLTSSTQRTALIEASYACQSCGIGAGEVFLEGGGTVRLTVRSTTFGEDDHIEVLCQKCRLDPETIRDAEEVALKSLAERLTTDERRELVGILQGNRGLSLIDRARSLARRLPASYRERAISIVSSLDEG